MNINMNAVICLFIVRWDWYNALIHNYIKQTYIGNGSITTQVSNTFYVTASVGTTLTPQWTTGSSITGTISGWSSATFPVGTPYNWLSHIAIEYVGA